MMWTHLAVPLLGASLTVPFFSWRSTFAQVAGTEPNRGGTIDLRATDPDYALSQLKVAEGYEVSLFASEKDFPALAKPVAMSFDAKGRLWVATIPSYPQWDPTQREADGKTPRMPDDKILILEDTDGDGKADSCKVFADKLHLPIGFEFGMGGAFVSAQPNLLFLKDTDGDDVADVRRIVLHGFGTSDSHHSISAFYFEPGGGLCFQEGTFHHTQVETPHGPVRVQDAAVFRYEPRTEKLSVFVSYPFANPWGHTTDRFGQNFISDASGGSNYYGTAFSGHSNYPQKHDLMKEWTLTKVRPTSGCEFVTSRHFPDNAQGNFLLNNVIGFQGIKQYQTIDAATAKTGDGDSNITVGGSGFVGKEIEPLLQSSDINFRPVDLEFAPDGSLYIVDFFNPLIGHMQYPIRDSRRDRTCGRIWRITAKGRKLLEPAPIAGQPIASLLEQLKTYEDRHRYRVRIELDARATSEVVAVLKKWTAGLSASDPEFEHHLVEALWIYQRHDIVEIDLLKRMLGAKDFRARAAAVRVLQCWRDRVPDAMELLRRAIADDAARVRLEAVRACSFVPTTEAAEIALLATKKPMDDYLDYCLKETLKTLEPQWKAGIASGKLALSDNPAALDYLIGNLSAEDLKRLPPTPLRLNAQLYRSGIPKADRSAAIDELAKLGKSTRIAQLLAAATAQDSVEGPALPDFAQLLVETGTAELKTLPADSLSKLALKAKSPLTRQAAFAAMMIADGSTDRAWKQASASIHALPDLLLALPLVRDEKVRAALYPQVKELTQKLPAEMAAKIARSNVVKGRFVRIELGSTATLSLAEVQVFSGATNIALSGKATQSSVAEGGAPDRAIDGNTDGYFSAGSVTHTVQRSQYPWWEVDLGEEKPINTIVVWNRIGGDFGSRLNNFKLVVLDGGRKAIFRKEGNPAPKVNARFEISPDPAAVIRSAAVAALSSIPGGSDDEKFAILAAFLKSGQFRDEAVASMLHLDSTFWDDQTCRDLSRRIVGYVAAAPLSARKSPAVKNLMTLGERMAGVLPEAEAKGVKDALKAAGESEFLDKGKLVFMQSCVTCHQVNGKGLPNAFPPLVGSKWLDDDERAIKIVLYGLQGEITLDGLKYNSLMAPLGALFTDEQIADVITYVRNEWGNSGAKVKVEQVEKVREQTKGRTQPYLVEEILKEHPIK